MFRHNSEIFSQDSEMFRQNSEKTHPDSEMLSSNSERLSLNSDPLPQLAPPNTDVIKLTNVLLSAGESHPTIYAIYGPRREKTCLWGFQ